MSSGCPLTGNAIGMPAFSAVATMFTPNACSGIRACVGCRQMPPLVLQVSQSLHERERKRIAGVKRGPFELEHHRGKCAGAVEVVLPELFRLRLLVGRGRRVKPVPVDRADHVRFRLCGGDKLHEQGRMVLGKDFPELVRRRDMGRAGEFLPVPDTAGPAFHGHAVLDNDLRCGDHLCIRRAEPAGGLCKEGVVPCH